MSGFLSTLQQAIFNGIPVKARVIETTASRKLAIHRYPFKNGGWPEDLGRDLTIYTLEGHLIGDDAPALAALLKGMADVFGSGILIHPALGAVLVHLMRCTFGFRSDALRVINIRMEFIEAAPGSLAATIIATVLETLTFAGDAQSGATSDFQTIVAPAVISGPEPAAEASTVVAAAGKAAITASADPTAAMNAVATLLGNYGRYAAGNAGTPAPASATVESLIQGVVLQQQALAISIAAVQTTLATLSGTTDIMTPLIAMMTALAGTANNPSDQVRLLLGLGAFTYVDGYEGVGLVGDIAIVRDATAAAIRRAALIVLAQISTTYQPTSYQDAMTTRNNICAAIDAEVLVAGDNGDDQTYVALRNLRAAVSADLTARGAKLASIVTVTERAPLTALVIAYQLYQDSSRSDELIRYANPQDPSFMPLSFQALSS